MGVSYSGETLVVTYADGTMEHFAIMGGGGGVVNVQDGRLPFDPVAMRIAWLETPGTAVDADTFEPPATVGTTAQTLVPDFPQDFLDAGLRQANLAIWAATDLLLSAVTGNYITEAVGTALTVDGVAGSYWITTALIGRYDGGNPVTLVFPGMLIATRQWVLDLPQGPGGGTVDQTARDAAAAAQTDADAAGSVASAAAGAASTAQGTADSAQTDANTAQATADTGVANAGTAQTEIDDP